MSGMNLGFEVSLLVGLFVLVSLPVWIEIPIFIQMLMLSVVLLILGCDRASKREKIRKSLGEHAEPRDVLAGNAIWRFPLTASAMLLVLFLAFKYLPNEIVSFILTFGSVSMAVIALSSLIAPLLDSCHSFFTKRVGFNENWSISLSEIVSVGICAPIGFLYYFKRYFLANNLLACGLVLSAIEFLALEDIKSGVFLLSGLFFYDIFWVFGSSKVFGANVMVTVAKKV
mmetsp:Transcript_2486/g.4369  ORF Transcript_2486/g.4369 Transcript_2486/m.4369 type:complete len:228 (-) Transcript_2486:403-1086(-)